MTRALIFSFCMLALAGCETAKGAGRDIEKVGGAISDAAQDVQQTF